jgi:hypothetical protein
MVHPTQARAEGALGPMPLVKVREPTDGGAHTSPKAILVASAAWSLLLVCLSPLHPFEDEE